MAIVKLGALLLVLLPCQLWALATDRDQPVEIEADELEVREQEGISIYQGNVKLVQGSLKISADRVVIHFNETNELTLLEMSGTPATLRQLDDNQQEIWGEAKKIDYFQYESLLELRDSARLNQAGDMIESDVIRINTKNSRLQAGSMGSDRRVKMLIQPRQDTKAPE